MFFFAKLHLLYGSNVFSIICFFLVTFHREMKSNQKLLLRDKPLRYPRLKSHSATAVRLSTVLLRHGGRIQSLLDGGEDYRGFVLFRLCKSIGLLNLYPKIPVLVR